MKKISALLALFFLFFASLALANTAVVTSATGRVEAQTGTAPARTLRVGDEVRQGDTIMTGPASSAVLKFDDGQIAALTANSRLTITAYQFNPQTGSGNVLLSLIDGGMRAITGLIGRRTPNNVAYRAATATIGIRGTDVTIATNQGNVVVSVNEGLISFTFQGKTLTIPQGQAVVSTGDVVRQVTAAAAEQDVRGTALAAILEAAKSPQLLTAINSAAPGQPREGGPPGAPPPGQVGPPPGPPPGPPGGGGGGGGGGASPS